MAVRLTRSIGGTCTRLLQSEQRWDVIPGAESPENENGDVTIPDDQGEANAADDSAVLTAETEAPGEAMLQGGVEGEQEVRKPDPVHEVCPDMEVKIADLGNACWVVREYFMRSKFFAELSKAAEHTDRMV